MSTNNFGSCDSCHISTLAGRDMFFVFLCQSNNYILFFTPVIIPPGATGPKAWDTVWCCDHVGLYRESQPTQKVESVGWMGKLFASAGK